jgi:hypothetical protein
LRAQVPTHYAVAVRIILFRANELRREFDGRMIRWGAIAGLLVDSLVGLPVDLFADIFVVRMYHCA